MSDQLEKLIIDLGDEESIKLIKAASVRQLPKEITVLLPLPCFGKSNSHLDLRDDLLYASFAAEQLAAKADGATAEFAFSNPDYLERIRLILSEPNADIFPVLHEAFIIFNPEADGDHTAFEEKHSALWEKIGDFEDQIDSYTPYVPEIVDWYFGELLAAYYEIESEAPEYFEKEMQDHPERRLEFYRSAHSAKLGASCFTSQSSWLIPEQVNLDDFFTTTAQKCRLAEFEEGNIFVIDQKALAITKSQIVYFPLKDYFQSRVVASLVNDKDSVMGTFFWSNATFTHSAYLDYIRSQVPEDFRSPSPHKAVCLVHGSGDLISINDGSYNHILYDTKPLHMHQVKSVLDAVNSLSGDISALAGFSANINCRWEELDDEQFESLCYDILYSHPKFDNETIKKIGKSRSRDGGRDIIVSERSLRGEKPRKWIFQCKLITDGSSLTARKLQDLGDMLDQYNAEGFGVMTSAIIDATLYDKIEAICKKRSIDERHSSRLELEREIARYPGIKARYFKPL